MQMADTGSEQSPETRGFAMVACLSEAECEALSSVAARRELVRLWSSLDVSVQNAIIAIVRNGQRADSLLLRQ